MECKLEWMKGYHTALETFRNGDLASAEAQFRKCLEQDPSDRVCPLYLEHIAAGEQARSLTMTEK